MKPQETIDYHIKTNWLNIANLYNQLAQKHGLTQSTGLVLLNIDGEGTAATKIAPIMGQKNTSLSRVLRNLETQGLIYRQKADTDKRYVKVFLTPKGEEKKDEAKTVVKEYNKFLINHINENDLQCFFKVMKQIFTLTDTYKTNKISDK